MIRHRSIFMNSAELLAGCIGHQVIVRVFPGAPHLSWPKCSGTYLRKSTFRSLCSQMSTVKKMSSHITLPQRLHLHAQHLTIKVNILWQYYRNIARIFLFTCWSAYFEYGRSVKVSWRQCPGALFCFFSRLNCRPIQGNEHFLKRSRCLVSWLLHITVWWQHRLSLTCSTVEDEDMEGKQRCETCYTR